MEVGVGDKLEVLNWDTLAETSGATFEYGEGDPSDEDYIIVSDGKGGSGEYHRVMGHMGGIHGTVVGVLDNGALSIMWDSSFQDAEGDFPIDPDDYYWYPGMFRKLSSLKDRTRIGVGSTIIVKPLDELKTIANGYGAGIVKDICGLSGKVLDTHNRWSEDEHLELQIAWDDSSLKRYPRASRHSIYLWMVGPAPEGPLESLIVQLRKGPITVPVGGASVYQP